MFIPGYILIAIAVLIPLIVAQGYTYGSIHAYDYCIKLEDEKEKFEAMLAERAAQ